MSRLHLILTGVLAFLLAVSAVVPSCVDRMTGLPRHRDEDRLRDEMRHLELEIRDEQEGPRKEELRGRFRDVYDRLEEIAAEQRRRAPQGERP
jgi:hypothetical protein